MRRSSLNLSAHQESSSNPQQQQSGLIDVTSATTSSFASLWMKHSSSVLNKPKQQFRCFRGERRLLLLAAMILIIMVLCFFYQNVEQYHKELVAVVSMESNFDLAVPKTATSSSSSSSATMIPPAGLSSKQQSNIQFKDKKYCDEKYRGILHIEYGDRLGAAGSIFFLFILNQLIYADMYQLLPWIHLNHISQYVYDEQIHGNGPTRHLQVWTGAQVSWSFYFDEIANTSFPYPGPPVHLERHWLQLQNTTIPGNGVWESYFYQPLYHKGYSMPLFNCSHLPVLKMTFDQVIPTLHAFCPWSVRAWKYGGMPPTFMQQSYSSNDTTVSETTTTTWDWLQPQRQRAHEIVNKYYHFKPTLLQRVKDVWQNATKGTRQHHNQYCLGMHVRHSDKANLRKRIPTDKFKPYVEAYRKAGGTCVYLATDSDKVVSRIRTKWPSALSQMVFTADSVLRSVNKTAVFVLGQHHRTNTEVLVDIVSLSKCQFLLHGYSAVSEASIYINLQLHYQSVNLEDKHHRATVEDFERMVRQVLRKQDKSGTFDKQLLLGRH